MRSETPDDVWTSAPKEFRENRRIFLGFSDEKKCEEDEPQRQPHFCGLKRSSLRFQCFLLLFFFWSSWNFVFILRLLGGIFPVGLPWKPAATLTTCFHWTTTTHQSDEERSSEESGTWSNTEPTWSFCLQARFGLIGDWLKIYWRCCDGLFFGVLAVVESEELSMYTTVPFQ